MTMRVGGPMFENAVGEHFQSVFKKEGAHYNVFAILSGMAALRVIFPAGEANEFNVALFSTSGIHGMYTTIEKLESSMLKYGETKTFDDGEYPDDYHGNELTVLIVQPRIVCLRYGHIAITLADIPWLKNLRASSWRELSHIGEPTPPLRKPHPALPDATNKASPARSRAEG